MSKSAGRKAAKTKREKYGPAGLREIAKRAYRTRQERREIRQSELERHIARSAGAAMSRARKRGLNYESDLAGWAVAMMVAQNHRCALSKVNFSLEVFGHGAAPRPFAPSIDRIDARGGYTLGNIRIICWAANLLLNTWGDKPAVRVAKGIASNAES